MLDQGEKGIEDSVSVLHRPGGVFFTLGIKLQEYGSLVRTIKNTITSVAVINITGEIPDQSRVQAFSLMAARASPLFRISPDTVVFSGSSSSLLYYSSPFGRNVRPRTCAGTGRGVSGRGVRRR